MPELCSADAAFAENITIWRAARSVQLLLSHMRRVARGRRRRDYESGSRRRLGYLGGERGPDASGSIPAPCNGFPTLSAKPQALEGQALMAASPGADIKRDWIGLRAALSECILSAAGSNKT